MMTEVKLINLIGTYFISSKVINLHNNMKKLLQLSKNKEPN